MRIALLEALTREGPLTATEAAELLGESPANCSFHLRTLQKYGFVEEAEGGTGRARPWRRVDLSQSWSESSDDPEASIAAHALAEVAHERVFDRIRNYEHNLASFSPAWRQAAFGLDALIYVTPEELAEIGEELLHVLSRLRERTMDIAKRPDGSAPVQFAAFGNPLPLSPSGN